MDVMATSVASSDVRASVVRRLLGADLPDDGPVLGDGDDEESSAPTEPLTVDRIARSLLDGARRSPAETRTQQVVAGVRIEHTTVHAQRVEVEVDGDRARVQVETFRLERTSLLAFAGATQVQETDPLVIDLDGDGIETTGLPSTATFDLDGDGTLDRASLASGGDALLALDRDGDGAIGSGRELFGDHHGAADGIAELATFDDNGDGVIDAQDAVFDRLRLLYAPGVTSSLSDAGITHIDLARTTVGGTSSGGDRLTDSVAVGFSDGRTTDAVDVLLRHD